MSISLSELEELALGDAQSADAFDCSVEILCYKLENIEITVPADRKFFPFVDYYPILEWVRKNRERSCWAELEEGWFANTMEARTFTGFCDFGHTNPGWENIMELGIAGLLERAREYARRAEGDEKKTNFYKGVIRVYESAVIFAKRCAEAAAAAGRERMADGLFALSSRAPKTLFEAIQTTLLYYTIQTICEGTPVRTLGRLDSLYYPFYINEEKCAARKMMFDFMSEIDLMKVGANMPFAIGGTGKDGKTLVNELSYLLVEAYIKVPSSNVKYHFLTSTDTPNDLIKQVLDGVRKGRNSVVFLSDEKVIESLIGIGAEPDDARNYHVVGCYECGADGEVTCSCNAKLNMIKAVEYAMNSGVDMMTGKQIGLENDGKFEAFEDFFAEYERQLEHIALGAMDSTDIFEKINHKLHAAPAMSATYDSAMNKGADIYAGYGAKYNNSSLNGLGIATVTDSLVAIKKLVFDDKTYTLEELRDILKNNWQGAEKLRLEIRRKFPKYGQGNREVDALAKRTVDILERVVSGRPNQKGGVWRLGLFSINWRHKFGEKTAASADGRLAGETVSQNSSATFGADINGTTAHLRSVAALDASRTPNGTIVDLDLHHSAVVGDDGLDAMLGALRSYFALGGFAVHYNVLNSEVLKRAKDKPEDYPNLQVRLCGWNVKFSSLSEKEQNEIIKRADR